MYSREKFASLIEAFFPMIEEQILQLKLRKKILQNDLKRSRKKRRATKISSGRSGASVWEREEFLSRDEDGLGRLLKPFLETVPEDHRTDGSRPKKESCLGFLCAGRASALPPTFEKKASSLRVSEKNFSPAAQTALRQLRIVCNKVSDASLEQVCGELSRIFARVKRNAGAVTDIQEQTANILYLACIGQSIRDEVSEAPAENHFDPISSPYRAAYCAVVIYLHCTEGTCFGDQLINRCVEILEETRRLPQRPLPSLLNAFTTLSYLFLGGLVVWEDLLFLMKHFLFDNFNFVSITVMLQLLQIVGVHLFRACPEKFSAFEHEIRVRCATAYSHQQCECSQNSALEDTQSSCSMSIAADVMADVLGEIRSRSKESSNILPPFPPSLRWIHDKLGTSFISERRVKFHIQNRLDKRSIEGASEETTGLCTQHPPFPVASESGVTRAARESASNVSHAWNRVEKYLSKCNIATDVGRTVVEILTSSVNHVEAALRIGKIVFHEARPSNRSAILEAVIRCYTSESRTNDFYCILLVELFRMHGHILIPALRQALENIHPDVSKIGKETISKRVNPLLHRLQWLLLNLDRHGITTISIFGSLKKRARRE